MTLQSTELIEYCIDYWYIMYNMINWTIYSFQKRRNLKIISAKRAKLEEKKKQLHRQLVTNATGEKWPLERETILALEIEELLAKLKNGDLDPVAVLEAYQARALEATEATNCIVDFMLEARTQARRSNWQNEYILHKLCKIKNSKHLI